MRNLAYDVFHKDVFHDCKYIYGLPLFRIHYEFPTNPSLKENVVNNPDHWWEIDRHDEEIFEDVDEFGYVAMQLTHFPKCIGYDCGNMLSYLPIYDLNISAEVNYHRKQTGLMPRLVHANLLHQARTLPFKFRTDDIDCLTRLFE